MIECSLGSIITILKITVCLGWHCSVTKNWAYSMYEVNALDQAASSTQFWQFFGASIKIKEIRKWKTALILVVLYMYCTYILVHISLSLNVHQIIISVLRLWQPQKWHHFLALTIYSMPNLKLKVYHHRRRIP